MRRKVAWTATLQMTNQSSFIIFLWKKLRQDNVYEELLYNKDDHSWLKQINFKVSALCLGTVSIIIVYILILNYQYC